MTPEHIVVRLTVVPDVSSTEPVEAGQPETPKRITDQFLAYLADSKRALNCRCQQPLDPEPETLGRTCLNCLAESRWRQRAADFYRRTYPEAMVFAQAIMDDQFEAEEAVSETFVEFMECRTESKYFFRALKFNCLNRLGKVTHEQLDHDKLDEEFVIDCPQQATNFLAPRDLADGKQDPIEVLISRKEYRRLRRLIDRARFIATTDRKYRWIKQKEWAKPLNLNRRVA
jgi:DNA-directed RNA polymerase specialized sigma24 family protein